MQTILEYIAGCLGSAFAALAIPILWAGYFLRSPWIGALAGICTAAFLTWGGLYVGNDINFSIIIACIFDGLLFGFFGKKYKTPKSERK